MGSTRNSKPCLLASLRLSLMSETKFESYPITTLLMLGMAEKNKPIEKDARKAEQASSLCFGTPTHSLIFTSHYYKISIFYYIYSISDLDLTPLLRHCTAEGEVRERMISLDFFFSHKIFSIKKWKKKEVKMKIQR